MVPEEAELVRRLAHSVDLRLERHQQVHGSGVRLPDAAAERLVLLGLRQSLQRYLDLYHR